MKYGVSMFHTFKIGAIFVVISLLLAGPVTCSAEPAAKLNIRDPWARPAAMGGNAVVYFTLVNKGNLPDALVGANSITADTAGIHETRMEGNTVRMAAVPRIDVPAGGRIELDPGGFHVMLVGLKHDLKPGDKVNVTLLFEKSVEITVEAEVRQP